MTMGTWQQIALVDLNSRHRSRSVVVQIRGK